MKVLLNVRHDVALDKWMPCQGVKLVETADGSLDLIVTTDLKVAQTSEEKAAELRDRIRAQAATSEGERRP